MAKVNGPDFEAVNDRVARCAYVSVNQRPIARTIEFGKVNIDVDEDGQAVGVEFFGTVAEKHEHGWYATSAGYHVPSEWRCGCGDRRPLTAEERAAWNKAV